MHKVPEETATVAMGRNVHNAALFAIHKAVKWWGVHLHIIISPLFYIARLGWQLFASECG